MKVYTKIIFDKNDKIIYEDYYEYEGKWARLGIHYDFKSTRGQKLMEKQRKKALKLAERKKKKQEKLGNKLKEEPSNINIDIPLSLEEITNPDKDK